MLTCRSGLAREKPHVEAFAGKPAPTVCHVVTGRTYKTPWFPAGQAARERHAVVIGAGIAGASVARSLAERGFTVEVLERHALAAQEASGNPAGIVLPVLSRTGNALSHLTQLGMVYAQQRMGALMQQDACVAWQPSGVLRMARNPRHAAQQEIIAAQATFPANFARWVDAFEASTLVGVPVEQSGWWFAGGGSVCPPALVNALLEHESIRLRSGVEVQSLHREAGAWVLTDAQGHITARCETVVLANADAALRLLPAVYAQSLPLAAIRGQISLAHVAEDAQDWMRLRAVACREGYVIPARDGQVCFGASFTHHAHGREPSEAEHLGNVERLQAIFPQAFAMNVEKLGGRVSYRCATPDRLPMLGPLHDAASFRERFARLHLGGTHQRYEVADVLPGLWLNVGHGARGLVWTGLLGEALACMISGEASPLPQDLIHALHPARFDYRLMRSAPAHRKAWVVDGDDD